MSNLRRMLAEANRELAMRKRLYPRWVQDGRMSAAAAAAQIEAMEEIAQHLRDELTRLAVRGGCE